LYGLSSAVLTLRFPENVDSPSGIVYRTSPLVKAEIANSRVTPDVLSDNRWFSACRAAENSLAYNVLPINGLDIL
jgi:hypothetical protein